MTASKQMNGTDQYSQVVHHACIKHMQVFAVSPKVHTTQRATLGIFTEDDAQVVRWILVLP